MSRWRDEGWYGPTAKEPAPERGIRVKKAGTTWWGQRWIEALEHAGGDSGRLARGRTYARGGRTHDLVVSAGRVTSKVTGSRPKPYDITLTLTVLDDAAWKKAIAAMAKKAQFSADLVAGQMPQAIDEAFRDAGVSLFPRSRTDLVTSCSCPDWGDPCKHVAATHYVLGEALDRDPFLLFELRGRTKDQVLEALRAARGGEPAEPPKKRTRTKASPPSEPSRSSEPPRSSEPSRWSEPSQASEPPPRSRARAKASRSSDAPRSIEPDVPTVQLGDVKPDAYDAPRDALPALHFRFDAPVTHGAVLRQLGAPAAWAGDASPADVLAPLVRAAAERARRIATSEPSAAAAPAAEGARGEDRAAPRSRAAKTGAKPRKTV